MKKIIIIVLVLVLVVAGGLGGAAILGKGPLAPFFNKTMESEPAPAAAPQARHRVYALSTIVIPIVEQHAIRRQVGMELELDVEGAFADRAGLLLPRVQHTFLLALYDTVPRHSNAHSAADRQAIHDRLMRAAHDVLGEEAVRDVRIKSIYDR